MLSLLYMFDESTTNFISPNDSLQNKLFKMVLQKQLHECQNQCIWKGKNGTCRFSFSFFPHVKSYIIFNRKKNKWEYYRP